MFSFLRKNLIGELVILVVESDYNEKFNMHSHILLSSPTKIKVGELKTRISGVTSIPPERILLLFCGQILTIERDYIPEESFEPCNVVDEDNLSFRPRLCLRIMDDPTVHIEEEEPDADRRRIGSNDDTNKPQAKQRHKHKHKGKNEFDLERELSGEVNCVPFASLLRKQGYDNEGAFANLSIDVLHGQGLWIPMAAARRIHSACLRVKKRLAQKDREEAKHHYRHVEASGVASPRSEAGLNKPKNPQQEGQDEDDDLSDALEEVPVTKSKADARREYEAGVIRQKKAAREEAALLKSGKGKKQTDALKQHPEELQRRIEAVRRRCAQEAEQSSGDFDEITGILYNSYSKLRATNQKMNKHLLPRDAKGEDVHGLLPVGSTSTSTGTGTGRASTADGGPRDGSNSNNNCNSDALVVNGGGSPTRALRGLRTSASSASFSSPSNSSASAAVVVKNNGTALLAESAGVCGFCCSKHQLAVLTNREKHFARRRLTLALELQVQLNRLRSAHSGFVNSATLRVIAQHHLQQYRGMPRRSADPSLVTACVEASALDLHEQRATVQWVQRMEVDQENLLSVVPVCWYSPGKFIAHFVDLLEALDRERLDEEPD